MKLYHPDSVQTLRKNKKKKKKEEEENALDDDDDDEIFLLTSDIRQERLNAIRVAYDALRGRKPIQLWGPYSGRPPPPSSSWGTATGATTATGVGGRAGERRSRTRRKWIPNEWGGFEYEPHVQPHPDGLAEPFFLSKHGVMMCLVLIVVSYLLF